MLRKKKKSVTEHRAVSPEEKMNNDIKKKERLVKQLRQDAIIKVTGAAAALIITFTCVFGVTLAPTNDMFPAVHEGDLVIYFRPGRLVNTDVVIYEISEGLQIGRIQGTAGETLGKTDGGLLTINGNLQPVQKRRGLYDETYAGTKELSGEIGSGEYLILGDQRETARDSRVYGLISRRAIKGKVFTIIRRRPL